MSVQFHGAGGSVFTFDPETGQVSIFCRKVTIGVLGGRNGWHQLVPVADLLAAAEYAKASGWEAKR
jgi:hypothetical protein